MTEVIDHQLTFDGAVERVADGGVEPGCATGSRRWPDVLGVAWVVLAGVAVLLPAIVHGGSLGSYDWLAQFGLARRPVSVLNPFTSDQIRQMIPWTDLAWSQVHHGHLPLWNPFTALGTPLAFNWQSATFSVPALVGYMVPQRLDYTVQLVVTMIVGGTGAYVLARVLRLTIPSCVLAGITAELCGTFFGWLGWPVASVMSWTGWLFAATVLIVRGRHRARDMVAFSVLLACAVYAGQPDTLVLLLLFVAVFALALLIASSCTSGSVATGVRSLVALAVAAVAGLALSAPLLLPGLQLISRSSRTSTGSAFNSQSAIALGHLGQILLPGLDGWPVQWSRLYLGVVALVLAAVGVAFHHRRPAVVALIVVAVATAAVTFIPAVISVLNAVPGLKAVRFPRSLGFLEFAVAILAAVGLSTLTSPPRRTPLPVVAGIGFAAVGVVPAMIWAVSPNGDGLRTDSFIWAIAGAVAGLVAVVLVHHGEEGGGSFLPEPLGGVLLPRRLAAALLVVFETVFLVALGTSGWPSTSTPFAPTPAIRELQATVGSSLVGLGTIEKQCAPSLGIPANANIAYGIDEFGAYDPMLPGEYYSAWSGATGQTAGDPDDSGFCPAVDSVAAARRYGVSYILEPHGSVGPPGTVFVRSVGGEELYQVPSAAEATLIAAPSAGGEPSDDAPGTPVAVHHADPNQWELRFTASRPEVLRLHLTASPGWSASMDGRSLPLSSYSGIMLEARVPAGPHVVKLVYWPKRFTLGLLCALLSALGLVALLVVSARRGRRMSGRDIGGVKRQWHREPRMATLTPDGSGAATGHWARGGQGDHDDR